LPALVDVLTAPHVARMSHAVVIVLVVLAHAAVTCCKVGVTDHTVTHVEPFHMISSHDKNDNPVFVLDGSLSVTFAPIIYNHPFCTLADVGKSDATVIVHWNCTASVITVDVPDSIWMLGK
jgi:hypothetical protein